MKYAWQHFCSIATFSLGEGRGGGSSWKTSEILGLFVNTLPADDNYSCYKPENSLQAFQLKLSKKSNAFYQFFIDFLESTSNYQHFEIKKRLINQVFPKFLTLK